VVDVTRGKVVHVVFLEDTTEEVDGLIERVHCVERIEVGPDRIEVELLPTFVGCPAQDLIRSTVIDALAPLGRPAVVGFSFRRPWTSDRITELGRERLAASGFAPPAEPAAVRCPYCRSGRVAMDSAFGSTQCRSLFYCRDCRQPFEAFKPV